MTTDFESCRENLVKLVAEYDTGASNLNEATTRLRYIDRLFFECLGWDRSDCISEESHGGEYADYTFSAPRRVLIVEAKREGGYFELPAGTTRIEHSIPTLARDNPGLQQAIEQVAGYCQSRGVLLAAVSNGHQVVAFVAVRHDAPPLDGRALTFPSLASMVEHFRELWNALSKSGVQEKRLETRLVGYTPPAVPAKLASSIPSYPGTKARNRFQTDLKIVSELVLEDVASARELEPQFLKECYCQSGALSEYSLISRDILQARYAALFDANSPGPTTVPVPSRRGVTAELIADSISRRPILLLGDVGVGKTTFLRNLMNVEAAEQFADSITLHLNLGTQAALALDLRQYVVEEMKRQLLKEYGVDVEEAGLVTATYHGELERFARGIYGSLRELNPHLYAEKKLDFLKAKLGDAAEHLKHTLEHVSKGRRKQVIVFLDNSDQRDYATQQQAFLIAQEVAANWPVTVFVTLRPETFHLSLRSGGTLSGYHPKAFTVSPPRIDRVLDKRLRFALKLTRGEVPIESIRNVSVQLHTLEDIIQVFLNTLGHSGEIGELTDNISGGNVRLALDLVQSFFGSGHVDTKKIADIYTRTGSYFIPLHEFLRAVIYGDSVHYDPSRSYIANLYDLSSIDPKEHFLVPLLLSQLADWSGPGIENGFVDTTTLYDRLQGMGYAPEQIDEAMLRSHRHRLIETSARRIPGPGQEPPDAVRATTVGVYHVERLMKLFTYTDAIIVDTPIIDRSKRERIHVVETIEARLERASVFQEYLDTQWQTVPPSAGPFSWPHISADLGSDINKVRHRLGLFRRPD